MGYTTAFEGKLFFTKPLNAKGLAHVKKLHHVDSRKLPEFQKEEAEWYHFAFELTDEFDGIQWDGSEKFYGMSAEAVNGFIGDMRAEWPNFGLRGEIYAQGENVEDRWILKIQKGVAVRVENPPQGRKVKCPHCEQDFFLEEAKE